MFVLGLAPALERKMRYVHKAIDVDSGKFMAVKMLRPPTTT